MMASLHVSPCRCHALVRLHRNGRNVIVPIDRLAPVFSDFTVHTPKLRDVRLSIGVELRYNSGVSEKDRA